mgnify:CR=1 FL=1
MKGPGPISMTYGVRPFLCFIDLLVGTVIVIFDFQPGGAGNILAFPVLVGVVVLDVVVGLEVLVGVMHQIFHAFFGFGIIVDWRGRCAVDLRWWDVALADPASPAFRVLS